MGKDPDSVLTKDTISKFEKLIDEIRDRFTILKNN